MRGTAAAATVLAILLGVGVAPARGQEARARGATAGEQRRETARVHFKAGQRLFRARRFREAIGEFELAQAKLPSADLHYNIARCHEELGEPEAAIAHYREYLRAQVDAPDATQVRARIENLEREVEQQSVESPSRRRKGLLRINANVTGASVALEGKSLGTTPLDQAIALAPGRYRLEVTRSGYLPFRSDVTVGRDGSLNVAYADLQRGPPSRESTSVDTWSWVVGSLAAVALGTSAVFGGLSLGASAPSDRRAYVHTAEYCLAGGIVLGLAGVALAASHTHDDGRRDSD